MLLNTFQNKIVIKGTLQAISSIHIGTGKISYSPQDIDNGIIRNVITEEPFIPGSSLKGMLRAYAEALLPSIDERYKNACIVTENPCLRKSDSKVIYVEKDVYGKEKEITTTLENVKKIYKDDAKKLSEILYENACPICRIFGSQVMAAKIQINDSMLKEGSKAIIEKRDGVAIDRDSGTAANRMKYDFECVGAGAEFEFYMAFNNIEEDDKEMIDILISYLASGEAKIGGKKSVGLGEIKLENITYYKVNSDNIKEYIKNGLTEGMRCQHA